MRKKLDPQATQLDPGLAQHRPADWLTAEKKCIFPERRPNLAQYQNNVGSGNYLLQKNAEVPVEKRSTENGEHF